VDQSSPNFFLLNAGGNAVGQIVFRFWIMDISVRSGDIRAQSWKGSEIEPNLVRFSRPKFFWGAGFQIFGPAFVN